MKNTIQKNCIAADRRQALLTISTIAASSLICVKGANAQDLGSIINAIGAARAPNQNQTNTTQTSSILGLPIGVSNADADSGIRAALGNGAIAAITRLGRTDGYWRDSLVKILLPNPLKNLQTNLRALGLSGAFDDLQLKINRAAELAAPQALEVFQNAIRTFTVSDVVAVLRGSNTAGTDLLKSKTKPDLITRFRPVILGSVNNTGAGRAIDNINRNYGRQLDRLGGLRNLNGQNNIETGQATDLKGQLVDYSVSKALDGMFYYIGNEEAQIRQNPAKRTSDLLRKVFGGL